MHKAFTLIETILAITIISLVIAATAELTQSSLRIGKGNMDQFVAYHLAEEGIEIVRNIRDSNWLQNKSWNTGLDNGKYTIVEHPVGQAPKWSLEKIFIEPTNLSETNHRVIEIGDSGEKDAEAMKVTSTVYYLQSGVKRSVSLTTELTDWKK